MNLGKSQNLEFLRSRPSRMYMDAICMLWRHGMCFGDMVCAVWTCYMSSGDRIWSAFAWPWPHGHGGSVVVMKLMAHLAS